MVTAMRRTGAGTDTTPRQPGGAGGVARRRTMLGAGAALAGAALAACTGAPTTGPTTGGTGASLRDQKFSFLHWWTDSLGPGNNDFMSWSARTFQEKTGAQVELVDGPTGGGLNGKLITMITGGLPPDATFISVAFGRDNYDAGMLKNLTPYVAKAADLGDKEWFDSSRRFRMKGNDTYGIPVMGPESNCLSVSTNLLTAAGLDGRGADIKTWDDLLRVAQKLTKASGDSYQQIGMLVPGLGLPWLQGWLHSNGASLMNADDTKYQLDTPVARETVQNWMDLLNRHNVTPKIGAADRPANARNAFTTGQVGIIWDSSSIRLLNAPPEFKFWIVPIPKGPRGSGPASMTWTNYASVPSSAKSPDAAVEWIRFFTSVETGVEKLKRLNSVHPRLKFYDTPEWKKVVDADPVMGRIPDMARLPGFYPYMRFNRLNAELAQIFTQVNTAQISVNQGLAEAQRLADQIIAEPVRVQ
jgi:ABC-type glycerol-3-phosphate transport system substrate-binding protein